MDDTGGRRTTWPRETDVPRVIRTFLVLVAVTGVGLLVGVGYAAAQRHSSTSGPSLDPAGAPTTPTPTDSATGSPTPSSSDPATPTPSTTTPSPSGPPALWSLGATGTKVRGLEARLAQLDLLSTRWVDGYYGTATRNGVSTFQAAHGLSQTGAVDAVTWATLRGLTHLPTHDELYPKVVTQTRAMNLDKRCLTGHVLCIDKTSRQLAWVVDGKVQMTVDVRFGSEFHPTREGQFSVYAKDIDHVSTLYGSKMPYAMFFSGGEAVHYSSDFAARGYAGHSHGCVNVRDRAAIAKLFDLVHLGDKVVVYRG